MPGYHIVPQGISPYQELKRQLDQGISLSNAGQGVVESIIEEAGRADRPAHALEHEGHLVDALAYTMQMQQHGHIMTTDGEHVELIPFQPMGNPCCEIGPPIVRVNGQMVDEMPQNLQFATPKHGAQIRVLKDRFAGGRRGGKTMMHWDHVNGHIEQCNGACPICINTHYEAQPESNHHMGVCKFGGCIICRNAQPKPEKIITKFQAMGGD